MTLNELVLIILLYVVSAVLFWYLGASNERRKCRICRPRLD